MTHRPPHLKHFDYTGFYRYSLTFCTYRRRELFKDATTVALVLSQIVRASTECECALVAYCFMPDHLHLLIQGQSESAHCTKFIALAKQYSGYYYSKEHPGRLWQRYSYEHTLRKDEDTRTVARYILTNPIRAGLAANVEDYPFAGSLTCELKDLVVSLDG